MIQASSASPAAPAKLGVLAKVSQRLKAAKARRVEAEGGTELRLIGRLDGRMATEVKAHARAFTEGEATSWSIDLSGVTAWDGNGLAALVYALDVSELAGKTLYLVDPCLQLRQTMQRSQLHHLFPIVRRDELGR